MGRLGAWLWVGGSSGGESIGCAGLWVSEGLGERCVREGGRARKSGGEEIKRRGGGSRGVE